MKLKGLLFCVLLAGWACVASADTLRLKNGHVIEGFFIGGDTDKVQFMGSDGRPRAYALGEIASLTFAGPPKPAASPAPKPASVPKKVTVPAGSLLIVRMVDSLDTGKTKTGDRFTATLDTNLAAEGAVVVRKGATVHGRVKNSQNARRLTGQSKLDIELSDIVIQGTAYPIMTGDFAQAGSKEGGKTLVKTAGGAGLGAAVGAIAGDTGKGAAIGAVAGLGLAMTKKGQPIRVPSETLLQFTLQQPVTLPVAR